MRDPNRIDTFTQEFSKLWKEYFPDWRFGQLFNNLQRYYGSDLFYCEENKLLQYLEEFCKESRR